MIMVVYSIKDIYRCDHCKSSSDEYGRMCKHGALFPVILVMDNRRVCPNYEFDPDKVKLQIKKGENNETER